jgi:hypothetical protein
MCQSSGAKNCAGALVFDDRRFAARTDPIRRQDLFLAESLDDLPQARCSGIIGCEPAKDKSGAYETRKAAKK